LEKRALKIRRVISARMRSSGIAAISADARKAVLARDLLQRCKAAFALGCESEEFDKGLIISSSLTV
jgi:hypothetical protein